MGKYHYKRQPMGIANHPDIFQHNMNDLFHGFEFICEYIDEIFILTKGYWTYHVQKLELIKKDLNVIFKDIYLEIPKWNSLDLGNSRWPKTHK